MKKQEVLSNLCLMTGTVAASLDTESYCICNNHDELNCEDVVPDEVIEEMQKRISRNSWTVVAYKGSSDHYRDKYRCSDFIMKTIDNKKELIKFLAEINFREKNFNKFENDYDIDILQGGVNLFEADRGDDYWEFINEAKLAAGARFLKIQEQKLEEELLQKESNLAIRKEQERDRELWLLAELKKKYPDPK